MREIKPRGRRKRLQISLKKKADKAAEAEAESKEPKEKEVTPGKLILLLEPVIVRSDKGKSLARTGLEGFLAECGVDVVPVLARFPLDRAAVPARQRSSFTATGRRAGAQVGRRAARAPVSWIQVFVAGS